MSDKSAIEWTDATWNPVRGCTKVSPGCKHCYAETFAERFRGVKGHPYEQGFDLRLVPEALTIPLQWKKPRYFFVNSMSDLFHEDVPDEYIDRVFAVMALCPQHTFQVLTKRPERMYAYVANANRTAISAAAEPLCRAKENDWYGKIVPIHSTRWPLPNVWLGVSVEDQQRADERIPCLLRTPAAVRFLSCEPLLGPIRLPLGRQCDGHSPAECEQTCPGRIDWVIVGGESGPGARPCNIEWIRSIIYQCQVAKVPCFVKQLGARPYCMNGDGFCPDGSVPVGCYLDVKSPKGGDMNEWIEDLRVREFPKFPAAGSF